MCPARLFTVDGGELLSKEGTTQGDPISMSAYALGILPLLQFLLDVISVNELNAKEVAFADDFTVACKISSIKTTGANYHVLAQTMVTFRKHQNLTS